MRIDDPAQALVAVAAARSGRRHRAGASRRTGEQASRQAGRGFGKSPRRNRGVGAATARRSAALLAVHDPDVVVTASRVAA
jgi:hypothetical protein